METRKTMKPYHDLANSIVLQAVDDYRKALRGWSCYGFYGKPEDMIRDCERFFNSHYFQLLTSIDGEYLMQQLKEEYQRECTTRSSNT